MQKQIKFIYTLIFILILGIGVWYVVNNVPKSNSSNQIQNQVQNQNKGQVSNVMATDKFVGVYNAELGVGKINVYKDLNSKNLRISGSTIWPGPGNSEPDRIEDLSRKIEGELSFDSLLKQAVYVDLNDSKCQLTLSFENQAIIVSGAEETCNDMIMSNFDGKYIKDIN